MKRADQNATRPFSVARRTAIAASLMHIGAGDPFVLQLSAVHRAILCDDLCKLSCAVDLGGVSEAMLACAAADVDESISLAARVAYSTRLQLRAAGLAAPVLPPADPKTHPEQHATLEAGLEAVRSRGLRAAVVPRPVVGALFGAGRPQPAQAAIRILTAAYSNDLKKLVALLCAPPFCIEAANVHEALAGLAGPPREVLSAGLVRLRGGRAKDAGVAALRAIDSACRDAGESFALMPALAAAQATMAEFAREPALQAENEELLRCAESADRIWSIARVAADPSLRVDAFVDSVVQAQLEDTTLVPYASGEPELATMAFDDMPSAPVAVARFAQALECDQDILLRAYSSGVLVHVRAQGAAAAVSYLAQRVHADRRRFWLQPEVPESLRAPKMVFSASRLNSYVKCPRRFFYEYLCDVLDDPGSLHATYGRVMHDALEALHREVRVPSRHEPAFILDRLHRELEAAFGRARQDFATQLEYEASRWRARRMAEQYVRWLVAESARSPVEITGVELFERRRLGEYDFVGYIDRIDKPLEGGPVTIYDYKTGRIDSDPSGYLEKVRRGEEAQLALYYAMRRAAGDDIARIALVSLRDPRDDVWILALDVLPDGEEASESPPIDGVLRAACSRQDLDASLAALFARCDMLAHAGVEHFAVGEDPPCHFCAYANACRERPIEGERAFAR